MDRPGVVYVKSQSVSLTCRWLLTLIELYPNTHIEAKSAPRVIVRVTVAITGWCDLCTRCTLQIFTDGGTHWTSQVSPDRACAVPLRCPLTGAMCKIWSDCDWVDVHSTVYWVLKIPWFEFYFLSWFYSLVEQLDVAPPEDFCRQD